MSDKKERRGLGRGLSALMADVDPNPAGAAEGTRRSDRTIPIERIHPNPDQPRRSFSEDQLAELANSIRTKGVIQPLIVRPHPTRPDSFEIVAGERRWRAAQIAQLHQLPVLVRDFDDTEVLEVAIIENIQRADLNPIEEAMGYRQLMTRFGHTQEKLAEALGKSRSHIANLMRLLSLPETVQDMVTTGKLSAGHARTLITAPNPETLAERIVTKGLSVRAAEKLARDSGNKPAGTGRRVGMQIEKDADTRALEADLSAALGMNVRIDHPPGQDKGSVTISYDTLEHLDALCSLLSTYR
ncbi:ParB/RepB/Spo0J family partition protein [Thetidibacter halocola]|uniref:ParB/RepB/Spo0J family partition protein n=1 Tax=Thetidibacter halocola TaxID=2827239 RepID=A0A8J8B7E7_9RHOB|nr:ParB/RepB/Spo0J family partition protein [Thetidibacter halocola]MBS0123465.1 ParB/RepB/Spo0J family partition protein [Thetidibacter halocola]